MQTKKIILSGLTFLAFFVAIYSTALFILVKVKIGKSALIYRISDVISWKGGNSYQKFEEFDSTHEYDIIVIGSSHAYRGYDPRIFKKSGVDLFNLGTSAQSVLNSYYISKNYITDSNCKLAILELYDGALSSDAIESTSDLVQNIKSDEAALEMALAIKDPRGINMFVVRMMTQNEPVMYFDSAYVFNGFSEKKDSVKNFDPTWFLSKPKINELQVSYLKDLIAYFKTNNIKVLLVSHPAPKELNNGNHKVFTSVIENIAKEYAVDYWDYSFIHSLNPKFDFYDAHHLNQNGVLKFNKMLLEDLRKNGYLSEKKQ